MGIRFARYMRNVFGRGDGDRRHPKLADIKASEGFHSPKDEVAGYDLAPDCLQSPEQQIEIGEDWDRIVGSEIMCVALDTTSRLEDVRTISE